MESGAFHCFLDRSDIGCFSWPECAVFTLCNKRIVPWLNKTWLRWSLRFYLGLWINNWKWLWIWVFWFPNHMVSLWNNVLYRLWINKGLWLRLMLCRLWIWVLGFPHNSFTLWSKVRLGLHRWHLRLYRLAYRSAIHIKLRRSNKITAHQELVLPLTVLKSPVAHHFIARIVKQPNIMNLVICRTIILLHK